MSTTNMATTSCRRTSILTIGILVLMTSSVVHSAEQRFCGKQLVKMLSMLCEEFPDLHYGAKKSVMDFDKMDYPSEEWMTMLTASQDTNPMVVNPGDMAMMDSQQTSQQQPLWMSMMYPQNYPFRTATGRNDLIPARFRKSFRGIVDECCVRPCSVNQLMKYCKTVA